MPYKTYKHPHQIYTITLGDEWSYSNVNIWGLNFINPDHWQLSLASFPKNPDVDFQGYITNSINLYTQKVNYWSNIERQDGIYFNYEGVLLKFTDRSVPGTVRKTSKYILNLSHYYVIINLYVQVDSPLAEVTAFLDQLPEFLGIQDLPLTDPDEIMAVENQEDQLEKFEKKLDHFSEISKKLEKQLDDYFPDDEEDPFPEQLRDALEKPLETQTLDLSDLYLEAIPEEILQLENLKTLDISRNLIGSLPEFLLKFTKLESLDANGCNLTALPDWIYKLKDLKHLSLYNNEIRKIPDRLSELRQLSYLNLGGNSFGIIPPAIYELPELEEFIAYNAAIDEIPPHILSHPKLNDMTLSTNYIQSLPENISSSQIHTLRLSHNKIHGLTNEMLNFPELTDLSLNNNPITELPSQLFRLPKLESLKLYNCLLTEISSEIKKLSSLKSLSLEDNKLSSIPDSIGELKSLKKLNLEGNEFKDLPKSLSLLTDTEIKLSRKYKAFYMDISYQAPKPEKPITDTDIYARSDPEMMEILDQLFASSEYADLAEACKNIALKGIAIRTTDPCSDDHIGLSKFGGKPDLPADLPYPTTDGELWLFLAQLNLADFAPYNSMLPSSGYLWFFVESLDQIKPQVVYRDVTSSALQPFKPSEDDTFYDDGALYGDGDGFYKCFNIHIKPYPSLPSFYYEDFIYDLDTTGTLSSDEDIDLEGIYSFQPFEGLEQYATIHGMNTYVFTQNESPQRLAAEERGGEEKDWLVLLMLDSDGKTGFEFWDAGFLYFLIHKDDLANRDFSRIFIDLESS